MSEIEKIRQMALQGNAQRESDKRTKLLAFAQEDLPIWLKLYKQLVQSRSKAYTLHIQNVGKLFGKDGHRWMKSESFCPQFPKIDLDRIAYAHPDYSDNDLFEEYATCVSKLLGATYSFKWLYIDREFLLSFHL